MEQIGNRISFVKGYTKTEKIAINTKIDRILKELSDMQLGPCSFKLSEEITCIYCQNSFHYSSDKTMGLTFKYKDYDENDSEYRNGHYDTYSAKSLFITEYERRLRQDLLNARKVFDLDEKSVFDITYTRADGMDTILEAKNAGVDIDLTPYLELPDLTEDEIESFVKVGYGYDRTTVVGLTLKEISQSVLPEYLQIVPILRGTKSLNNFISNVLKRDESTLINERKLFAVYQSQHPLDSVLNWEL